jgi:hypothetical protein
MMKKIVRWLRREKDYSEQNTRNARDAEVEATKEHIRKRLHEQAQRVHYLEIATELERIRATKRDKSS